MISFRALPHWYAANACHSFPVTFLAQHIPGWTASANSTSLKNSNWLALNSALTEHRIIETLHVRKSCWPWSRLPVYEIAWQDTFDVEGLQLDALEEPKRVLYVVYDLMFPMVNHSHLFRFFLYTVCRKVIRWEKVKRNNKWCKLERTTR